MGKTKKKSRLARSRASPFPERSENDSARSGPSKDEALPEKVKKLLGLLTLETVGINEKLDALNTITVMMSDSKIREELLKEKLIAVIFEQDPFSGLNKESKGCFLDTKSPEIMSQTLDLLKGLVFENGYAVSMHLWKKRHVWQHLEKLVGNLKVSFSEIIDSNTVNKNQKSLIFEMTENLVGLMVALLSTCEKVQNDVLGSDKIDTLMNFVVPILNSAGHKIDTTLFNGLLDLLFELNSESVEFVNSLTAKFGLDVAKLASVKTDNKLSRALIYSITFQIADAQDSSGDTFAQSEELLALVRGCIALLSEIDYTTLTQNFDLPVNTPGSLNDTEGKQMFEKYKKSIVAKQEYQSVETVLDLLSSVIEYVGTSTQFLSIVEAKESSQSKKELDRSNATLVAFFNGSPIVESFLSAQFLECLYKFVSEYGSKFEFKALNVLVNLGNLFESLEPADVPQVWQQLSNKVSETLLDGVQNLGPENDQVYGIESTMKKLLFVKTARVPVSDNIVPVVAKLAQYTENVLAFSKSSDEAVQEVASQYLSAFVQLTKKWAQSQGCIELNRAVGQFYLGTLLTSYVESLNGYIVVELIDAIFDIYGDKQFDYDKPVFVDGNFLEQLVAIKEQLKNEVFKKLDRKKDARLKDLSLEAVLDLERFIKYKRNE